MRGEQRTDSEDISHTEINDSASTHYTCSLVISPISPLVKVWSLLLVEVNKNFTQKPRWNCYHLNCVLILITVHNRIIIPVIVILLIVILSNHSSH